MYKYLLCWRYLRTRYIALVSVISVTLGVATLIVVNSVMSGFSAEMKDRLHGILSDVVIDSRDFGGFEDPEMHMARIHQIAGDKIEAMTPTVTIPAMLYFKSSRGWASRPVQVIGIDEETYPLVSDFAKYLQHPENRKKPSFGLHESGYDVRDHQLDPDESFVPRIQLKDAGWLSRRSRAKCEKFGQQIDGAGRAAGMPMVSSEVKPLGRPNSDLPPLYPGSSTYENSHGQSVASDSSRAPILEKNPPVAPGPTAPGPGAFGGGMGDFGPSPFDQAEGQQPQKTFDPEFEQRTGIILGLALISSTDHDGEEYFAAIPGDDVNLTIPTTGQPPKGISDSFTVVDLYESKMSEYDAQLVFVPIGYLQTLRGMIDRSTGIGRVNQIQIKVKAGVDPVLVRNQLREAFDPRFFSVVTWMDMQGALLHAVEIERAVLNVLLFLIIAVAGFGILAIFLMIVIEKTRDIGIMKSLGASRVGIMGIFLNYGLLLGVVGSGVGVVSGLLFVKYINGIADFIGKIRGEQIFDPSVYYFAEIPTIVDPLMIVQIVIGTLLIAVLASILPALRAAFMHPVEALRHE